MIASIVAVVFWDNIRAAFPPDDEPIAQGEKVGDPVVVTPPKPPDRSKPTTPAKARPDKPGPKNNGRPKNDPPRPVTPRPVTTKPPPVRPNPTPKPEPRPANNPFPRRALVISVHDYLYANPIHEGLHSSPRDHNLKVFIEDLNQGLKVPLNQIAHLSDQADRKWGARAPTKVVIEKTLTSFLDSSRPQDRVMIFFIGHSVEMDDDVYLAPIEAELDKPATLIPLKWFYEQLAKCKARQKVLVLDVNRYNQTFGQERPGGGEMGPKLDAMLKEPPAGVQVWSSCIVKQKSYETDESPMGVFIDDMMTAFQKGLPNKIQRAEEALPLEAYVERVNGLIKEELSKRKLEQVSRLSGKEADSGVTYKASDPAAPDALASLAGAPEEVAINKLLIDSVRDQISTPPVKVTHELAMPYDALPPFSVEVLQKYQGDKANPNSPLRKAVKNARAVLWAIYPGGSEPRELADEVNRLRGKIKLQLNVLRDGYRAPPGNAEARFKSQVENDERAVALIMLHISDALEALQADDVVKAREEESKRWKANYDFLVARMQLEYAYLFEYQSMLGSMRKEFPPRDAALQGGWKLASTTTLQGDSKGKKFAKVAQQLLDKIAKDNAGSPWEVLAKREKLTNLGLEWQATK